MAAAPYALYVNSALASDTPSGLNELLEMVSAEAPLAMVPRFEPAYWGISAFGTGLFDGNGRLTLATSGFTEWLAWLEAAQEEAGIILNPDEEALRELFMAGRAAYYVGSPDELPIITASIEPDSLEVVRLPNGPVGPAGPLIGATAVMLGTNSSDTQTAIAQTVADFLTNRQQSTTFMRELGHIPTNADVVVDPRIYPLLSGFARQLTSSNPLPNTLNLTALEVAGNRAYVNALSGLMTPEEAVCLFGWNVITTQELTEEEVDLPPDCKRPQLPTEMAPATK
jgi:ABC-type glycerol-3-phosphate transport system substrate-binding protein